MSQKCYNCLHTKAKLSDLIQHYEQLIITKDEQIVCSHKIIKELEQEIICLKQRLANNGLAAHQAEERLFKMTNSQDQTIQYLKQRQIKLIEQLKKNERELFKLVKEKEDNEGNMDLSDRGSDGHPYITPKKKNLPSPIKPLNQNITLGKENSQMSKLMLDTSLQNRSSEGIKLKLTEDQLKVMQVKHKIALLKCFQISSLR